VKRVFVDTSGFYALIVRDDENHARAHEVFQRAHLEAWSLLTTNAVVFETHALLLHRARPGREIALAFLDTVGTDQYQVVRVQRADEQNAIAIIRSHRDKTYSLCDALSFAVMERLHVESAIAFDRDFRVYGRFSIL
jgi:predicted nucleic acid-binding protein